MCPKEQLWSDIFWIACWSLAIGVLLEGPVGHVELWCFVFVIQNGIVYLTSYNLRTPWWSLRLPIKNITDRGTHRSLPTPR